MKNLLKYIIYRLYRIALLQEATLFPVIGFLVYISLFEILHLIILGVFSRLFFHNLFTYQNNNGLIGLIGILILISINYLIFVRNNKLKEINEYYLNNKVNYLKGNLIFWGYILGLFAVMFFESWLYKSSQQLLKVAGVLLETQHITT
jgi:hypothetical protein